MFQYNHISPYGIGTAFLLFTQEIFEIVDKRPVQFFERYILPVVSKGKKLSGVLADGTVTGESTLCPAVSHFLGKLIVVLFE